MALVDIDDLLERVRSAKAKSFVAEAITCYRAGAFRSCIIATWIALIYDFVEKFRELSLAGDAEAKRLVDEFDRIQQVRDTPAALKFEREVLGLAKRKFELISEQEYVDLSRLLEDRNRFGHPNLNQDSEALAASAELARVHLRNSIEHVLARPPVQGKAALAAIREAVDSDYFPRKTEDAIEVLRSTPLLRAKAAVVREFFLGACTSILKEEPNAERFDKLFAAAMACRQMHRAVVDEIIEEKFTPIFDKVDGKHIAYLVVVLCKEPELQAKLSEGAKIKMKAFVERVDDKMLSLLNFAANLPFLSAEVIARLSKVTALQLRDFTQSAARPPARLVVDRAIELLEQSGNWDASNAACSAISERMLSLLTRDDALRILRAGQNGEVQWSFNYPPLVKRLVETELLQLKDVKEFAKAEGIDRLKNIAGPEND